MTNGITNYTNLIIACLWDVKAKRNSHKNTTIGWGMEREGVVFHYHQ